MVNVHIQVVLIDYLILSLGGETSSVYPLQKAINCIMKVEGILDRKFLKPLFKETIKPPDPGKLQGILLPFESVVMMIHMYLNNIGTVVWKIFNRKYFTDNEVQGKMFSWIHGFLKIFLL